MYKHAGFLKNMREVLEKHDPQVDASRTSRVLLKIPNACIHCSSTMFEEQVFLFLL